MFGPDIGFQPQRLRRIAKVDGGDVAAPDAVEGDPVLRRMRPAPVGGEGDHAGLRSHLHPGEVVMIAVEHQVDPRARPDLQALETRRSEEHTSELPSLMRISYAVFCLK